MKILQLTNRWPTKQNPISGAFIKDQTADLMNNGANFEASGGFGSNQVSTAFGLGMFLYFYLWQQGTSFSGFGRFVDLALSGLFLFQGLLTFSRGGIIEGVLAIVLFILWSQRYSASAVKQIEEW